MTHMGFVTTVEQAPAVREAYARASHQLSRRESAYSVDGGGRMRVLTAFDEPVLPRLIVDCQVDCPSREVSEQHRA